MPYLKTKTVVTLLSGTAVLSACNSPTSLNPSGEAEAQSIDNTTLVDGGLAIERPLTLQSRRVFPQLLRPEVKLGADSNPNDNVDERATVVMTARGNQWVGSFSLPADTGEELAQYPLDVEWLYDIRTTSGILDDDIVLARSERQVITNNSPREIRITGYQSDQFDEDSDGVSNLDELNADQDPLNNPNTQNDTGNQADCRDLPAGLLSRLAPEVIDLSGAFNDTQFIARANNMVAFGQAFNVSNRGTLAIDMLSGTPAEGAMLLFDRASGSDSERVIATDNMAPLSVSETLEPGLYCLGVVVADLDSQVYSDVVMRYVFTP